jgi:hypothetical protein
MTVDEINHVYLLLGTYETIRDCVAAVAAA